MTHNSRAINGKEAGLPKMSSKPHSHSGVGLKPSRINGLEDAYFP
jgi:hypothetical protein